MDRSKFEYLTKYVFRNCGEDKWWELKETVDLENKYEFNFLIVKFLKNPDTTDENILIAIPNYENSVNIEECKQKYIKIFKRINALCIECKIYPFFKNPSDLRESEITREDLCRQVPEEKLNNFFGVESFYDYNPPVYEPEE